MTHLEAVGRTLARIAPWLELESDAGPERLAARRYGERARAGLGHATDPDTPDGSYPALGRSIAYRGGAFQLLAQMALRRELPEGVAPPQARGALTAVIRRTLEAPETFDASGWLRVGLAGRQPRLAEPYISTGSLYLCTAAFLPLGLPKDDPFWAKAPADWTSRQMWSGQDLPADHALRS